MATFEEEVKKACENCKQLFPESKVQLHEAYCLRNIRKCPDCDMYVDKREMEEHKEEFHLKVTCDKCGCSVENQTLMQKHIDQQCQMRPRECLYCKVKIPVQEFEQHQYTCGCRTKQCGLCKKNILMRDYEDHMDTCVGIVEEPKVEKPRAEVVESKQKSFPNSSNSNTGGQAAANKGSNTNIPSSYPQNSINQILRNDRDKESQKKISEQASIGLGAKKKEDLDRIPGSSQQSALASQNQRELANKPLSQYPSSSSSSQQYPPISNQQQRVPVSNAAINLDKNKFSNDIKQQPSSQQVPSSYSSKIPTSASSQQQQAYGQQPSLQNPGRGNQAAEKVLVDKYGKPTSSQGSRQPLGGNKQDIPPVINKPISSQGYSQQQQPQPPTNQKKYDDIYSMNSNNNNMNDKYGGAGSRKEDPKPNNNIYNARVNSKTNVTDAEKQKKDDERLRELNDLPTQGYYDNLKTIKNPIFDYNQAPQQQQQKPTGISGSNSRGINPQQQPTGYPSSQYPGTTSTSNRPPSNQYSYGSSQQAQYPSSTGGATSVTGQIPQTKQKPTISNQIQPNSSQSKNIPPNSNPYSRQQQQAPTKPSYEVNSTANNKNPPTGYKNHDEILRNVPSQALAGIPNYQPITKPGGSSSTTSTSSTTSMNQRVPSRGKYDNKPTSQYNQPQKPSSNAMDLEDEDDELQKAIYKSQQDQLKYPNQPARQPPTKNTSSYPQSSSQNTKSNAQSSNYQQQRQPQGMINDEEEELQRVIMESMKGGVGNASNNLRRVPSGKPAPPKIQPQNQQYKSNNNFEEDYDEDMARAIQQSLQK